MRRHVPDPLTHSRRRSMGLDGSWASSPTAGMRPRIRFRELSTPSTTTATVTAVAALRGPARHLPVRLWAMYWHFVGIVWALMFVSIFLI